MACPLTYDKTNNIIPPTPTITDISSITQHTSSPCQIQNECTNLGEPICFYHGFIYYPPKTIWITAICSGYFQGRPGLTASVVNPHIRNITATVQGHLNQCRQGLHSTKEVINESSPMQTVTNECNHVVYIVLKEQPRKLYSNQTGRFPYTLNWGHTYFVVTYIYDANAIITKLIKNCSHSEIMAVNSKWYIFLTSRGQTKTPQNGQWNIPYHWKLHQELADWNSIHTTWHAPTKCSWTGNCTPDSFPLPANFCCLTKQCNYMINMLRLNQLNPKLSTFEAFWGTYSFDATSMAPPGTKCYVHIKLQKRASWGYHATTAWYLGPIWCYKVLVQETGAICKSDTVTSTTMPSPSHQFQMLTKSSRPPSIFQM